MGQPDLWNQKEHLLGIAGYAMVMIDDVCNEDINDYFLKVQVIFKHEFEKKEILVSKANICLANFLTEDGGTPFGKNKLGTHCDRIDRTKGIKFLKTINEKLTTDDFLIEVCRGLVKKQGISCRKGSPNYTTEGSFEAALRGVMRSTNEVMKDPLHNDDLEKIITGGSKIYGKFVKAMNKNGVGIKPVTRNSKLFKDTFTK